MSDTLTDLDAAALLAAASGAVRERRLAEVRDLEVLAQWAAVHSTDPTEGPDGDVARRLGDVLVHLGGDGTPGVQDFCLGEIALARGHGRHGHEQRAGGRPRPPAPPPAHVGGA